MSKIEDDDRQGTKCVHAGWAEDKEFGAVNPAIQLSTTFIQPDVGAPKRFDYSRGGNPTRERLEEAVAQLEGAKHGFAFASGLAATDTIFRTCDAGDHVVCAEDAYGGTIRLLGQILNRHILDVTFVDTRDLAAVEAAITPATKWVLIETPTNPLLRVTDIEGVAKVAHDRGARLVVDNTFMSPALQNPLALGADAVFHSGTKYLGGHSDVLAGVVVCDDDELAEQIAFHQMAVGAVLAPFDAYLLLRGIRTLDLRMERHSHNAAILADRLMGHPKVKDVYYPTLQGHENRDVHARQARSGGGMLSFRAKSGRAARRLVKRTRIFQLAESLGAVESLVQIPAAMTHASVPEALRERTQLDDSVIRLSVGIEDVEDLWHDLETALGHA